MGVHWQGRARAHTFVCALSGQRARAHTHDMCALPGRRAHAHTNVCALTGRHARPHTDNLCALTGRRARTLSNDVHVHRQGSVPAHTLVMCVHRQGGVPAHMLMIYVH